MSVVHPSVGAALSVCSVDDRLVPVSLSPETVSVEYRDVNCQNRTQKKPCSPVRALLHFDSYNSIYVAVNMLLSESYWRKQLRDHSTTGDMDRSNRTSHSS